MAATSAAKSRSSRSSSTPIMASLFGKWYSSPPLETPARRATASSVAARSPTSISRDSKASRTASRATGFLGMAPIMPVPGPIS